MGGGGARRGRHDRRRLGPETAGGERARRRPRRAGRDPPRRGDGGDPARQAGVARGAPAVAGRDGRRCDRGRRRRRRGAAAAAEGTPRRGGAYGGRGAAAAGGGGLGRRLKGPAGEAALTAISVLPSLVALRGGDLAAYHGVEHKAIGAYEQDAGDAREATKEHDRCGSHLMAPLIAANLAGTAVLRRALDRPSPAANAAVQLASLGAAVEVFAWSERHAETATARALRRPGHELQRVLGTREPTDEQLEVGRAALAEILRAEGAVAAAP